MSQIKQEIVQNMSPLEITEGRELMAHFIFPQDFIGFKGHFPYKKMLPGVCQIQCILVMLEKWKQKPVVLREIVQAKFSSPVSPLEKITCVCRNIGNVGENLTLKASIKGATQRIAELKLRVSWATDSHNHGAA